MAETIETKIISIKDAKNGNFDIALKNFPQAQPQEGVVQLRANVIQIRNARNGNFDLVIPEDHTVEDALIQNSPMDEYVNDRVTEVKYYGFVKSNIKVINLPNVTKIDNSAFDGINASLVEEIYVPNCVTYGVSSFQRNPNLKIVDFGKANVNTNGRINNCPMLTTLILRNENNLISPTSATAIQNCPFAPSSAGGYVYVPQNLLAQYQASTDWQNYATVLEFRPIEGSEYEIVE